ncbi:MAG: hypothetical protein XE13_1062, partial [Proteiniphilum sp. 51_7]
SNVLRCLVNCGDNREKEKEHIA